MNGISKQQELWEVLSTMSGEEVLQHLTNWHGMQILSDEFFEFLQEEGVIPEDEEEIEVLEDNCDNKSFDCDTCIHNGDCVQQGIDGRPIWDECSRMCSHCRYWKICDCFEEDN